MSSTDDELRPVTVLFADVVGSTALGERLPPEEVKALIGECVNQMSRAVQEYGGTVQAYMGDGICSYFGVPVAREDDPERAARAALRILEVVGEYASDVDRAWGIDRFAVRVGINAGPAAVGLVGAGDAQTVAFGDTTNVAARLQTIAAPGTIAVGEAAARGLAHRFVLEPLGRLAVRGRTGEVEAQRLIGPRRPDEDRTPPPPLVGRGIEVERLRSAAAGLAAGRGQVVLLVGDAGTGKTRLVEELRVLTGEDAVWLEGHCLSYGGLPLWPFEEMLRGWIGLGEGEPEIAVRTKVRARLGALLGPRLDDALAPLGRLLRVRLDPDRPTSAHADWPEAIRRAYQDWVAALAARQPVVVAVEDVHWASADARGLAESLLELTDRGAVLLVATLRADPACEGWRFRLRALGDFAHRIVELRLGPLPDDEATELVRAMGAGSIDEHTAAAVVARGEGNPLFLEELVRLLLEGGGLQRRRTFTLTVGQTTLPARLESLLVARIDALPPGARRLAQTAAVIGRAFEFPVLERVAGGDGDIAADLLTLVRTEVVREVRRYPELACEFRHGLLHEAALSTLTPSRHRETAGRVGAAFEELLGSRAADEAERLASYYVRSDRLDKAISYLERAAAREGVDAGQAVELLEAAQKVATRLGDAEAERRVEARLAALETQGEPRTAR